jgi:hypothetical protein
VTAKLREAFESLRNLRRENREADLTSRIEELLRQPWSDDEAGVLRGELINEHCRHNRYAEAEALLYSEVAQQPREPYHSLRLGEHFHYYNADLSKSVKHLRDAIAKARIDGKVMYQALGAQARVAIELKDWSLLAETLHELAVNEHTPGNADVFPETDFLAHIPDGAVPEAVISAYEARVQYLSSIGYSTLRGPRSGNAA